MNTPNGDDGTQSHSVPEDSANALEPAQDPGPVENPLAAESNAAGNTDVENKATENSRSKSVRTRMLRRHLVALAAWTAAADWLVYRTLGFSGPAALFALAPLLFFLCGRTPDDETDNPSTKGAINRKLVLIIVLVLLWIAAIRLAVVGNGYVVTAAVALICAYALSRSGMIPWAIEVILLPLRSCLDGIVWISLHRLPSWSGKQDRPEPNSAAIAWILPLVATLAFAGIFVLANPDLFKSFQEHWTWVSKWAFDWLEGVDGMELPFCVAALIVGAGLFFPRIGKRLIGGIDRACETTLDETSPLYPAFRNTLVSLVILFAVYLAFEFHTLWRRDFPPGFYYAGYAHEGAAWLTVALALATGVLSAMFRGRMLHDPRLPGLKTLAWLWSIGNLLLATAVYNRLAIYVGYNGLTRMRILGFFGTSVVVVGFLLVVWKIANSKGFWWLFRTQLTALLLFLILLALFPTDYVAHRYNAACILSGYSHPSVMVAVKEKDDSGALAMLALVDTEDPMIREGVRALLAERQLQIKSETEASPWHWTRFQWATDRLYDQLNKRHHKLQMYLESDRERAAAISAFEDYAMKWY